MEHGQFSPAEKAPRKKGRPFGLLVLGLCVLLAAPGAATAQDQTSAKANEVPEKCKSDFTYWHIEHEVPRILDLGPSAAEVSKIEFLADVPRMNYYPSVGKDPALRMLQCPVRITWTNGRQDMGYYMEWEDHHRQVRVSFTPNPIQPPGRDY